MPVLMERPKMSLAMWAALKSRIMKQREKKKQEQEADAAVDRLKREQEMKRKQDAMTIEEIRDELTHLEKKLKDLRKEKHEMFLYLKHVLNEDEKRRNEEDKEANDFMHMSHNYPNPALPVGAQNVYMIAGNTFMNRNQVLYKVGAPPQQNGSIKGPPGRNQSPPSNAGFQSGYNYKGHVTNFAQKPGTYNNAVNSGYYPHSTAPSGTSSTLVVTNSTPYAGFQPIPHPGAASFSSQDQGKHLPYHVPHLQQSGYVGSLHQSMERSNQKPNMQEEKYYVHPTGGISSGYPVRGQPAPTASRFQPPPASLSGTTPIQVPARKDDLLRRNMQNESQR